MKVYLPAVKNPVLGYVPHGIFVEGTESVYQSGSYSYPTAKVIRDVALDYSLFWTELFGYTPHQYSMDLERIINDDCTLYIDEHSSIFRTDTSFRYTSDMDRFISLVLPDEVVPSEYFIGHYYIDNRNDKLVRIYTPAACKERSAVSPLESDDLSGIQGSIDRNPSWMKDEPMSPKFTIKTLGRLDKSSGKYNLELTLLKHGDKLAINTDKSLSIIREHEVSSNLRPIDHYVVADDNILSLVELMYKTDTSTIHGMAKAIVNNELDNQGVRIPDHPGMKTIGVLTHLNIGDVLMVLPNGSFFGLTHQQYVDMYGMEP